MHYHVKTYSRARIVFINSMSIYAFLYRPLSCCRMFPTGCRRLRASVNSSGFSYDIRIFTTISPLFHKKIACSVLLLRQQFATVTFGIILTFLNINVRKNPNIFLHLRSLKRSFSARLHAIFMQRFIATFLLQRLAHVSCNKTLSFARVIVSTNSTLKR